MKLERSLALYGLVERPADTLRSRGGVDLLDYAQCEHIDAEDIACRVRVQRLIHDLNERILGEAVPMREPRIIPYQPSGATVGPSIGLELSCYNRPRKYMWSNTAEIKERFGWTCGWIEAVHRRWLSDMRGDLPSRLCERVPDHLSGWPS